MSKGKKKREANQETDLNMENKLMITGQEGGEGMGEIGDGD